MMMVVVMKLWQSKHSKVERWCNRVWNGGMEREKNKGKETERKGNGWEVYPEHLSGLVLVVSSASSEWLAISVYLPQGGGSKRLMRQRDGERETDRHTA